jgi:hypothetical protein
MTTQYTPILKLALPVQGELSGTWGDVVNDNITSMVEQAIAGLSVVNTWTTNSHVLTTANGTTAESRAAMLSLTDSGTALTGAGSVICPALSKVYIVKNGTAQVITVKTAAGSGIAVPVGKTMLVYCDGTNVLEAVDHIVTLSAGTLTITGLTTFASLKGTGAVTVTNILDEDNMASDSATALATQQSIKAYVDSQVGTVDTLSEILAIGNTSGANNLIIDNGQAITTNTINETTAASGVTIDSVLLKDDGVNATNLEITNLKANDGTSAGSIADSTGVVTLASSVLTTADINGGTNRWHNLRSHHPLKCCSHHRQLQLYARRHRSSHILLNSSRSLQRHLRSHHPRKCRGYYAEYYWCCNHRRPHRRQGRRCCGYQHCGGCKCFGG